MKNLILVFLVIGSVLIFFGCQEESALAPLASQVDQGSDILALEKKPAPHLTGTMALDFNLEVLGDPTKPAWVGTITFEGHEPLGMRFFSLLPPREFSQARPFEENFEIYEKDDEGNVKKLLLAGHDKGVTTLANSKYRMNGEVEFAIEQFAEWLGHKVHMSGVITWQILEDGSVAPETAPGTFRIN